MGESQSTIGAGKSGAQSKQRFGPDAPWFFPLLLLVLLVLSPVGFLVCVAVAVVGQYRKARSSRIAFAAIASTVLVALTGFVADGAGPMTARWHGMAFMAFIENVKILDGLNWLTAAGNEYLALGLPSFTGPGWTLQQALMAGAPLGLVLGLWLAAAYSGWLAFRRRPLMKFEGEQYEWRRPEGVLDKHRRRASEKRLLTGRAAAFPATSYGLTGKVGVGVGDYGALITEDVSAFQRPALVFGGPRMGKTRFTCSLVSQLATRGSGVVAIDFKGDGEVPTFWATFAHTHGRRFLHFQMADKNGAAYKQPAPSAPAQQAFYDPVLRGNATSRADMLINSVDRDGDAKAYFRAAYELTQTAFAVAEGTGYDMQRGSLPALKDLLDVDHLQHVADAKDETGRPLLAGNPDIVARVAQMVATWKRDDVLRGAAQDVQRLISTRMLGPAVGAWMRPGPTPEQTIDLVRACLEGDVVVFSLPVQEYGDLARDVGTLALLDLQNAIAVLRRHLDRHREEVGNPDAQPPWAPMYVEVEEFGSAGAEAVLGVLNKAGDVQVRPFLSTQSYNDIVAVDGTGVFARRVLDQAGNVFAFQMTDGTGAEALSETTEIRTKILPRGQTEYSGGWGGIGLKAANLGKIDENPSYERQVSPGAFQNSPRFTMIWLKIAPSRATHSFKAGPNRWQEPIRTMPVPPDATAHLTRPAPGAANEGPSLDDVDDTIGSLEEVPAWAGAPIPTGESTTALTEVPSIAASPRVPSPDLTLPPGWDEEDDDGLHEPDAPIAVVTQPLPQAPPASTAAARERPAPPAPRGTPAWAKEWRSADEPTEVMTPTPSTSPRPGEAPTHTAPTAPSGQDSTTSGVVPAVAGRQSAAGASAPTRGREPSGRAVTQPGGTVGEERDTSGLLDLDGFDD